MFFRRKKTPSGLVLQLISSYRNEEGRPRQRVVVSLGNASTIPEQDWTEVAKTVERRLAGQNDLFEASVPEPIQRSVNMVLRRIDMKGRRSEDEEDSGETIDGVVIDRVTHREDAVLGPALAGLHAWRELKLDECLAAAGLSASESTAALVNTINRLVDPVSENALPDWTSRTALPDLLRLPSLLDAGKDRFYRVTDRLLDKQDAIEAHLRKVERETFQLPRTMFLYDLTNTYFEGEANANPMAKRGKSKEKRNDCPQIVVAMVFDEDGFALGHRIFDGNRNDSPTLAEMVATLDGALDQDEQLVEKPIVVVDGGLGGEKNRKLLHDNGYGYLANESRQCRQAHRDKFLEDNAFRPIKGRSENSEVLVRMIEEKRKDGRLERLILCKSKGRLRKEKAIRSQAETRFLSKAENLAKRVRTGKLKDKAKIDKAIGRLLKSHPRVARFYDVEACEEAGGEVSCKIQWSRKDEKSEADEDLLGCYVLRTNRGEDLDAEQIWHAYMTLTRAESGFRSLKSDLGLRPIRHHKAGRTNAHVFITVLAYHLLTWICHALNQKGDRRSWETIKRILQTHTYSTIVLPTRQHGTWTTRKAGEPDEQQRIIYQSLGIDWKRLPKMKTRGKGE